MLFSVLTRKGKVPRHNFYPPRSQSWLTGGRSQLAPSGPGSHALPSCHPWGSQSSNPSGPQSPQAVQMGRPGLTDCDSWQPLLVGHRDRDGGAVPCFSSPGPWLVEGLSESSGALQTALVQSPVCSLGPPAHLPVQGWVNWRASRRRSASASYLTLYLMTPTPWTLDWITSPVVLHWQLPVGRAQCSVDQ